METVRLEGVRYLSIVTIDALRDAGGLPSVCERAEEAARGYLCAGDARLAMVVARLECEKRGVAAAEMSVVESDTLDPSAGP